MVWYEDQYFWYVWKPHWLASSRGESFCLLDKLLDGQSTFLWNVSPRDTRLWELVAVWQKTFGKDGELGLVNRLDNDTAWLLYFAKSAVVFSRYKLLQQSWNVTKHYIADVLWRVDHNSLICTPLAHHRHLADRMVARRGPQDDGKIRWKKHWVETFLEPLLYNEAMNMTTVRLSIAAWIRHQIRVHCASLGNSLIGDRLYGKEKDWSLSLWCVGMSIS
jgi:23S rRNA-/tRNA-specific pseudouridylate synthase